MASHDPNLRNKSQTQGKGFFYVIAIPMGALIAAAVVTIYDEYRGSHFKGRHRDVKIATHLAELSGPFCVMEGVWHNWEEDETIELGCLRVKGDVREGSYSSSTGSRATLNSAINGTYDLDLDDSMLVVGTNREGKRVKFSKTIHVDDTEYPTQMILINRSGERGVYIWKRKE